ncbi:acyl-CoA thioesterase [Halomonas urumqiensis]|uniref:Thioesterase n=1 Tax=Halomonas urumqiensis TaxID=1684789 RepID=A0A2N7UC42_9GAMM|nr:thioesterase family protein [Halomonas urumqiensis]PMR78004.1 hypothetical protein C1H70_14545 [Halomonas urumqiensis]PTB03155.1 acyl-CoA thioesterase [Halomonas urumqiensis]GHE20701.1 hypothetical protein GCM10017767_12220 [Halomonas urumqiensis]
MERVRLEFPEARRVHRHPLSVRVSDMNYGGHLGHDALLSLMHEGRKHALAALGFDEWNLAGYPSVVADLAVTYQSEARWPDALVVETAIPVPQGRAICIYHRLLKADDDRVVATARLNLVLVDTSSGRPVSVPEPVRQAIAEAGGT